MEIDRKRKTPVTTFLRSLGYETDEEILELSGCQLCIYDNFCFPFGFECLNKPSCGCCKKKIPNKFFTGLGELEIPEIVGNIKPTSINIKNSEDDNEYRVYDEDNNC